MGGCALDSVGEKDFDAVMDTAVSGVKVMLNVTDEEFETLKATARAQAAELKAGGSLKECTSVKIDRYLTLTSILVQVILLAMLLSLLRSKSSRGMYRAWGLAGIVSLALVAAQMRHALSLAFKIAWHGSSKETRALLTITVVYMLLSSVLQYLGGPGAAGAAGLIVLMVGLGVARIVFMTRNARKPDVGYVVGIGVLDRVVSPKKVRMVRRATLG